MTPVKARLLMEMEVVPLLVSVATLGPPAFPTATLLQLMEVGEIEDAPAGAVPVPDKATESGVRPLTMIQVAEKDAAVAGLKAMVAVQLADAARLDPQVLDVTAKALAPDPEIPPAPSVTALDVVFATVMICEALVDPVVMLPKAKLDGDAPTLPARVPMPERDTL
ncbi:MAG TPA: hypothetical protein VFW25_10355 [Silvibacterium sp.]|nr:hypothetical protein [Silvibacterium sp.]